VFLLNRALALDHTMAELDLETKLSLSHRGSDLAALLPMLAF
jgi:inosine/xanthosine triphosphate pyrophosphatase family protein